MMSVYKRWLDQMSGRLAGYGAAFCLAILGHATLVDATSRIVSVGGAVTEIVYRLGAAEHLVGVDTSSTYPAAATQLPQVGYQRMLSVEGVLSLRPTLVLLSVEAGPPDAEALLKLGYALWTCRLNPLWLAPRKRSG
jgi:ABC-type hemin transport system substrate-binding protein